MDIQLFFVLLFVAYGLETVLGDPVRLPHPIRWIGRAITSVEVFLPGAVGGPYGHGTAQRGLGVVLVIIIVGHTYAITWLALLSFYRVSPALFYLLYVCIIWASLSTRSLAVEDRGCS